MITQDRLDHELHHFSTVRLLGCPKPVREMWRSPQSVETQKGVTSGLPRTLLCSRMLISYPGIVNCYRQIKHTEIFTRNWKTLCGDLHGSPHHRWGRNRCPRRSCALVKVNLACCLVWDSFLNAFRAIETREIRNDKRHHTCSDTLFFLSPQTTQRSCPTRLGLIILENASAVYECGSRYQSCREWDREIYRPCGWMPRCDLNLILLQILLIYFAEN